MYFIYLSVIWLLYVDELYSETSSETTPGPHENLTDIINPIIPIRFNYNSQRPNKFLPNISHVNVKKLHTILDEDDLFSNWISDTRPNPIYIPFNGTKQLDNRGFFLLKFKNYTFVDKNGRKLNISQTIIDSFQRWLVQEAACAMDYIWSELNENYWPRWIKKGLCVSTNSCSWPPGMNCKPKQQKKLTLLYWHCEDDFNHAKYDADLIQNERWRIRQKRQNGSNNRQQKISRRLPKVRRRILLSRRQKEMKIKRLIHKLSNHVDGIYCYWKKTTYPVVDSCSCYC